MYSHDFFIHLILVISVLFPTILYNKQQSFHSLVAKRCIPEPLSVNMIGLSQPGINFGKHNINYS